MKIDENIITEFWEHIENQDTKIAKKIYNWLNKDNLSSIIEDRGVFWTELTCSSSTMPDYIYEYIKNWGKERGLQWIYDLKLQ